MDSPGWCAQYCTYTLMEYNTKKIVAITTVDKRQTDRKSTNMEKKGLEVCLMSLMNKGCVIDELVTDAHLAIGAMLRKGMCLCVL